MDMRIGIITTLLLLGSAIWVANQQPKTVLAQEDIEQFMQCSGPEIPVGKVRDETDKEEERFCATGPERGCGGDACPKEKVEGRLEDVEKTYAQLQATRQAFSDLLHKRRPSPFVATDTERTWRDHILLNLGRARNGLQECVTPANFYDTAESDQEVDVLISCQEARLNGVLSEKQAQCFDNNFFCCTIKPTQ